MCSDADTATACPPILMDTCVSIETGTRVQSGHKTSGTERHPHMTRDRDTDEDWADGGAFDFETVDNSTRQNIIVTFRHRRKEEYKRTPDIFTD